MVTKAVESWPGNIAAPMSRSPGLEISSRMQHGLGGSEGARARAQEFIDEVSVDPNNPYRQHVDDVRRQLQDAGLPTDAEGFLRVTPCCSCGFVEVDRTPAALAPGIH